MPLKYQEDWEKYTDAEKGAFEGLNECVVRAFNSKLAFSSLSTLDEVVAPLEQNGWTKLEGTNAFRIGKRIQLRRLLQSDVPMFMIGGKQACARDRKTIKAIKSVVGGDRYRFELRREPKKTTHLYQHKLIPGALVVAQKIGSVPQFQQELHVFLPETGKAFLDRLLVTSNIKKVFVQTLDIEPTGHSLSWSQSGGFGSIFVNGSKSFDGRDSGSIDFTARNVGKNGEHRISAEANLGFIRAPIEISVSKFDRSL